MGFLTNKWATFAMLLACWALIASFLAAYYYLEYRDVTNRVGGALIYVNISVDFGNGTRLFNNSTKTVTGVTLFDVTKQVFNVTYQVGLYGTEVTSIESVSKRDSFGWTYFTWNTTRSSWEIVWDNADNYRVANGETFMWYYQNRFEPPS